MDFEIQTKMNIKSRTDWLLFQVKQARGWAVAYFGVFVLALLAGFILKAMSHDLAPSFFLLAFILVILVVLVCLFFYLDDYIKSASRANVDMVILRTDTGTAVFVKKQKGVSVQEEKAIALLQFYESAGKLFIKNGSHIMVIRTDSTFFNCTFERVKSYMVQFDLK